MFIKSINELIEPTHVSPDWKEITISGDQDVDFTYELPDGFFSGTITKGDGTPVDNGIITTLRNGDLFSSNTAFTETTPLPVL